MNGPAGPNNSRVYRNKRERTFGPFDPARRGSCHLALGESQHKRAPEKTVSLVLLQAAKLRQ